MEETTKNLILQVADGNPGALTVIKKLMWFSRWEEMMVWCSENGLTGSDLWVAYKDHHHYDWDKLGRHIDRQARLDKFSVSCTPPPHQQFKPL